MLESNLCSHAPFIKMLTQHLIMLFVTIKSSHIIIFFLACRKAGGGGGGGGRGVGRSMPPYHIAKLVNAGGNKPIRSIHE